MDKKKIVYLIRDFIIFLLGYYILSQIGKCSSSNNDEQNRIENNESQTNNVKDNNEDDYKDYEKVDRPENGEINF